jgi:hypothetical protein
MERVTLTHFSKTENEIVRICYIKRSYFKKTKIIVVTRELWYKRTYTTYKVKFIKFLSADLI